MFDFEKLEVYQLARALNRTVLKIIFTDKNIDPYIRDQWKRSSLGTVLNVSEGVGRVSPADKKHFFTMARGSVFESVALLQLLNDLGCISEAQYGDLYSQYEALSKMLLGLYRSA